MSVLDGSLSGVDVETRPVDDAGLVGVLCRPVGAERAPGVLLLGGSEGGFHERDAKALAAEGFTVLALAYFGARGLPPGLIEIPLEYFARGLDLLQSVPGAGARFGVTGASRGGEASLLVGAHDERIAAVVSVVGSGIVTQGIDFRLGNLVDILATPTVSWTVAGEPLPYLANVVPEELRLRVSERVPVSLRLGFAPVPTDPGELEAISIPVERIDGPVLLLSGEDDQSWPCADYSRVAADRLEANQHPYEFEHRVLAGAGHLVAGPPGKPFTGTTSPGPGVVFEMGGTPSINDAAREEAWEATVEFFARHLK